MSISALAICSCDDTGGLMLIVQRDGPLEVGELEIKVESKDKTLLSNIYRVPQEAQIPATVAIVPKGQETGEAVITVVGWQVSHGKRTIPLDRRDAIVVQIPADRVVSLPVVLSARCTDNVELVDGEALSTCPKDKTCDPVSGDCSAAIYIDASELPDYRPGEEDRPIVTVPPRSKGDAGSEHPLLTIDGSVVTDRSSTRQEASATSNETSFRGATSGLEVVNSNTSTASEVGGSSGTEPSSSEPELDEGGTQGAEVTSGSHNESYTSDAESSSMPDAGIGDGGAVAFRDVTCEALSPGSCETLPGSAARLLVGTVLAPDAIYRGGQVLVDAHGRITFVGCAADCAADSRCAEEALAATTVRCPSGVISPALINAHEHLNYAHNQPRVDSGGRYDDREQWRAGLDEREPISIMGNGDTAQTQWAELRAMLGGATAVVGDTGRAGLVRNLDGGNNEGLGPMIASGELFPLGNSDSQRLASGCAYPDVVDPDLVEAYHAYLPHAAEGVNKFAHNEFTCLGPENPGHDVLRGNVTFVNTMALTAANYAQLAARGTSLVWSPRSNLSLYGDTAHVTLAARLGVSIALATDWIVTGSSTLLRELHCADSFNKGYLDGYFGDRELWQMVTSNAAHATGTKGLLGSLTVGAHADVAIFDGAFNPDYRAVIDAEPQDVLLVMRDGKPLYGDAAVLSGIPGALDCDELTVCGSSKQVCLLDEISMDLAALEAANTGSYPALSCRVPDGEPTCVPSRPAPVGASSVYAGERTSSDQDGDGIENSSDNCPAVFNPIRPMDDGVQPDADSDSEGDACDACPVQGARVSCEPIVADSDEDGVPNAVDNCPLDANPEQLDADGDEKGDACDACPNQANKGFAPCPVTLYAIKDGSTPIGTDVAVESVIVTARNQAGYFLQVDPYSPGYSGSPEYSGVYVYDSTNTLNIGDRVSIQSAEVVSFFGRTGLEVSSLTVVAVGEILPEPVSVVVSDVATNGNRSAALEGVLVTVAEATVIEGLPDPSPSNEFVVDGGLRVNGEFYLVTPSTLGTTYARLTGVLAFEDGESKLKPRGGFDVQL